jgi:hypothetical protein
MDDVKERITFWYGCNVLRHGDIIHACIDLLRALGYEPHPVGGPDYCCGTVKDANQTAAGRPAPWDASTSAARASSRGAHRATRTCTTSWSTQPSGAST